MKMKMRNAPEVVQWDPRAVAELSSAGRVCVAASSCTLYLRGDTGKPLTLTPSCSQTSHQSTSQAAGRAIGRKKEGNLTTGPRPERS